MKKSSPFSTFQQYYYSFLLNLVAVSHSSSCTSSMIFSLLATPTAKSELSSLLGDEHITNDGFSFLIRALLHQDSI